MALYIINHSLSNDALAQFSQELAADDAVLWCQDGVYSINLPHIASITANHACYALNDDLTARQLTSSEQINAITWDEFVALTLAHSPVISY